MERKEAVALLKELGEHKLIIPNFVLIQLSETPNKYNLEIRGNLDYEQIESFLKERGFLFERNNNCLTVFKP